MREYELVYVLQPDATDEREAEIHQRVDGAIDERGGGILVRDDWGKRKLAYEIRKFQKGHYFQLNYLGTGPEVSEVERLLRLDADVLRFMHVQASAEVKDIEGRRVEAQKHAEEQAVRRAEKEKERAEREAAAAASPRRRDDDDDGPRRRDRDDDDGDSRPPRRNFDDDRGDRNDG